MEVKQEQNLCPIEECKVKTEFIDFPNVSVPSSLKTDIQEDQYVDDSISNDTKSYFVDGCPSDHLNMGITVEDIKLKEDKAELVQIEDVMEIKDEIKQEVGEYDKESQLSTSISIEDVKDEPPKGEDCSGFLEKSKMKIKTLPEFTRNKERCLSQLTEELLCAICNKQFFRKDDLKKHLQGHIKPFPCDICFKSFSRNSGLQVHKRSHTEKPYQCDICFKSFSQPGSMRGHRKLHTGEKTHEHQCVICFKSFSKLHHLNAHNEGAHWRDTLSM
ncbi:unnamed protein product [Diabrotica balteata]|uniref:C2H2-type domain-containing protein n=1 Tax=Diabrotica balteata TaxID=107213 RepID=A0A9N9STJ8_DIABA|nr:unnamed protein product [Diabrotica balteata]